MDVPETRYARSGVLAYESGLASPGDAVGDEFWELRRSQLEMPES